MTDRSRGARFDDADVAACYAHRPAYAPALFDALAQRIDTFDRALDLGCGPGKLTGWLAERFTHVDAVDPSGPMIAEARRRLRGLTNISWQEAPAESATLADRYDLVTAGASIHWMDLDVVIPALQSRASAGAMLAIIDGDGATNPPWQSEWLAFLQRWLEQQGDTYDSDRFRTLMQTHRRPLAASEELDFSYQHTQSVASQVACEHSRATFSRSALGDACGDFDRELTEMLAPHAVDGMLRYTVTSRLRLIDLNGVKLAP